MSDEDWVKVASVDDTVVAELLLRLKQVKPQPQPQPQPPLPPLLAKPALSLEWSIRQRRSKAVPVQAKKQAPRASPTTPLSWSGATSIGGGSGSGGGGSVDGGPEEESSRLCSYPRPPKRSGDSRSKVRICNLTSHHIIHLYISPLSLKHVSLSVDGGGGGGGRRMRRRRCLWRRR